MTHIDAVSPNEFPNKKNSDAPNRVPRFEKQQNPPLLAMNLLTWMDMVKETRHY